ncbi:Pyruvate kinase [Richelia intracellularis HM01]|nr:Pyruvate kinase [Richelia intracellularis HM01]
MENSLVSDGDLVVMTAGTFNDREILVTKNTSVYFLEAIRKAGGIITQEEGLNSHAAVIGLCLSLPIIVDVK